MYWQQIQQKFFFTYFLYENVSISFIIYIMTETNNQYQIDLLGAVAQTSEFNHIAFLDHQQNSHSQHISSKNDNDENMTQSPFRASDPTILNRHKIIGFQKTGQLLRRIKRQLSTQNLQKSSQKGGYRLNDKLSTQHSHNNLIGNQFGSRIGWQKSQKDEITQAMIDEYEKQILRLRAELQDIKEEKKEIKQTLQKQRRFYMSEMYMKQMIAQENQFQIDKLKGQIQKHINLQYQFQQKIRLLQMQNSEYKYQLQGWYQSCSNENSEEMEVIYEQNEDFCNQSTTISRNKNNNKMFMSLDNGFYKNLKEEDPFELIRLAHQKQILQYQKELKNMKQFYQNRIKLIRRSHTPQKNRPRNSISIMDQYICNDNISCQSQSYHKPNNLKFLLKDYQQNSKSSKKVMDMDCQSSFTIRNFAYPNQYSKKSLDNQNINADDDTFIKESISEKDYKQIQIQQTFIVEEDTKDEEFTIETIKENKIKTFVQKLMPSKQFVKGFAFGGIASAILTFMVRRKLNQ